MPQIRYVGSKDVEMILPIQEIQHGQCLVYIRRIEYWNVNVYPAVLIQHPGMDYMHIIGDMII